MNIWSTLVDLSMRKHFILKLFWCFWRHIQPLLVNKCWPESSYFFPGWKVWYQGFQMPCQLYSEDSYIKRYDFLKFHFFLKITQILCFDNAFLLWKMLLNTVNPPPKDTDVPPGIRTDVKSKFSDENFDCFNFFYTIFKQILHQITMFCLQP